MSFCTSKLTKEKLLRRGEGIKWNPKKFGQLLGRDLVTQVEAGVIMTCNYKTVARKSKIVWGIKCVWIKLIFIQHFPVEGFPKLSHPTKCKARNIPSMPKCRVSAGQGLQRLARHKATQFMAMELGKQYLSKGDT